MNKYTIIHALFLSEKNIFNLFKILHCIKFYERKNVGGVKKNVGCQIKTGIKIKIFSIEMKIISK